MPKIISLINLKGGVGKTTCSVAIAEFLADYYQQRVLVIDLDPQTNATIALITEEKWAMLDQQGHTIAQLFRDKLENTTKFDVKKAIQEKVSNLHRGVPKLALLPSSIRLIDLQDQLAEIGHKTYFSLSPVDVLGIALKDVLASYDYVIIDCPPNLGLITLNGLKISTGYVIPVIPDILSTFGLAQISNRVAAFSKLWNKAVPAKGIIVTKYRTASALHNQTLAELKHKAGQGGLPPLFTTIIPEANKIAEVPDVEAEVNTLKQKYGYGDTYDRFLKLTEEFINIC